jgi:peptidoglycan-associated lipoprotein
MKGFRSAVVVAHAVFLVALAAGCAKTPATTAATSPPPTGTATPGSSGRMDSVRPAAANSTTGSTVGVPGARPSVKEFKESAALKDVYFEFDKADIRPDAAAILKDDANWMKANPAYLVLIEGHCDERGTNEYNVALGERRARATMNFLVSQGVQAGRLTVVSYGEERPQCREHNEACWTKNRRAHFLVKAQ